MRVSEWESQTYCVVPLSGWFGWEMRDSEEDSKLLLLLVELAKDADVASQLLAMSFDKRLELLVTNAGPQVKAAADALLSTLLRLPLVVCVMMCDDV
jgi:hypothetical protein